MNEKLIRFLYFLLGLLVTDLIYSTYFYVKKEIIELGSYIIQPTFFLLVVFVDIIIIALIIKYLNRKQSD